MSEHDRDFVDHAAEVDNSYQANASASNAAKKTLQSRHGKHLSKHRRGYDPNCEQCRRESQQEYERKLASGELNRIDVPD